MSKKIFIVVVVALLIMVIGYLWIENRYQRNMDPIRISHVNHIASLVEEYKDTTGKYPFQDTSDRSGMPVVVNIDGKDETQFFETTSASSYTVFSSV